VGIRIRGRTAARSFGFCKSDWQSEANRRNPFSAGDAT
jgi:hypothetical protein